MYLVKLSREEKELFLGLAYNIANVDNEYSAAEKTLIAEYCREMQIEENIEIEKVSVEELLGEINQVSNDVTKKIILFESIGLAMIDQNYDVREREFIEKMAVAFKVEIDFVKECESIIREYISFQSKINKIVLG